jgi:hypothetical protein
VLQALRRFEPDVSPSSRKFLYDPINAVVFNPGVLTPDGAIYRKQSGKALAVLLPALLAGIVAGSIASYLAKLE